MPKTNQQSTASVNANSVQETASPDHDQDDDDNRAGTGAAAKALLAQWETVGQEQLLQSVNADRAGSTATPPPHTNQSEGEDGISEQTGSTSASASASASQNHSQSSSQQPQSQHHQYRAALSQELSLAAAVASFLATLKGQSQQTYKTYRVGCRRFMWFCWASGLGDPTSLTITSMSPFVLEDFYLWLVEQYGREARTTMAGYLAASRNLFEYLARRRVTPQGCQYQEMVAGLSKLQGRASYRTPRTKGKQVAQVVRLVVARNDADDGTEHNNHETPDKNTSGNGGEGEYEPHQLNTGATTHDGNNNEETDPSGSTSAAPTVQLARDTNENVTPRRSDGAAEKEDSNSNLKASPQKGWAAKSDKEKARQHLEEIRDRAIILTLYTTGMRRQEVVALNRADLEPLIIDAGMQSVLNPKNAGKTTFPGKVAPSAQAATTTTVSDNSKSRSDTNELASEPTVAPHHQQQMSKSRVQEIIPPPSQLPEPEEENVWELLITGKGQKERIAYFDWATLKMVAEYLALRGKDSYRPLFIQHHRNRDLKKPGPQGQNYRLGLAGVWSVVHKYGKMLGVDLKPHDFRHNLATTLLNAGAQLSEVQDILGHASPTTTKMIYAHYEKSHLRQAFARYRTGSQDL